MTKKYYMSNHKNFNTMERTLIIADVKDIVEKIELAGMVYVEKENIEDVEAYRIESIDSSENMELEEAKSYKFLYAGDFLNNGELTADERYYLENQGFIDLSDLEKFEDTEIYLTDAEMEELEKKTKKELAESIIEKMKKESITADNMESFQAWGYHDGSNWREIVLEHWFYDSEYTEITEELEDMKELDFERYNTGNRTLYQLVDGRKIIIENSYYQGSLWGITFIDADTDIENIKDAIDWIEEKEKKLIGW